MGFDEKRLREIGRQTVADLLADTMDQNAELRIIRDWLPSGEPFFVLLALGDSAVNLKALLDATGVIEPTPAERPQLRVLDGRGNPIEPNRSPLILPPGQ